MKLLVAGYYGQRNFGDDLLMKVTLDRLAGLGVEAAVTIGCATADPSYLSRWFPGLSTLHLSREGRGLYLGFDRVLFGGGGTVFDYRTSLPLAFAVRRRLSTLAALALPRLCGTRFASVGLGIGPFGSDRARALSLLRLRAQDLVLVRDGESLREARSVLPPARVGLCPDLSLLEAPALAVRGERAPEEGRVVVVVRHYRYGAERDRYLASLVQLAGRLEAEGRRVCWAAFQAGYDEPALRALGERARDAWVWDPDRMTVDDAYDFFARADCVVTARMHGVYLAGMLGRPVVGIGLHPKLRSAAAFFPGYAATVGPAPSPAELAGALRRVTSAPPELPVDALARARAEVLHAFERIGEWLGAPPPVGAASSSVPSVLEELRP